MKPAPKNKKAFNLILLGDPASGKGTQATRLTRKYHFYNLDMGREVRKPSVRAQFDYAKTTAVGHLTPTAVVRKIFTRVIASTSAQKGILFNGTPKMINEAKLVAHELSRAKRSDPLVIYLHIPARETVKRADKRNRDDDTARALRNRQSYYKEQITRVVAFFGEQYTVKKISGMGAEATVAKEDSKPLLKNMELRTPEEINIMAEGGRRLGAVLQKLSAMVRPGVTTFALDRAARALIEAGGDVPAFLNYRPAGARRAYPYTLCTSVNDVVVHGQPSAMCVLKEGDIISLDLGLKHEGFYLDAAITVGVGRVSAETKKLMAVTEESLYAGIKEAKAGRTLGDVGYAIERVARKNKFSVAEGLTGHGIGRALHEEPTVFNVGKRGTGIKLRVGMVIAIEPMITAHGGAIVQLRDESYGTADRSLAAHFEHTVAITENGPMILTKV